MAELLKGAAAAAAITEDRTRRLNEQGIIPCLAILRVGERVDDLSYERAALKRAEKIGIRTVCVTLPASCTQSELLSAIEGINRDSSVHGCLMFRPLPSHLDELAACEALLPEKDIDGSTPRSQAAVFSGKGRGFAPCTAQACMELLDYYGVSLRGKNVAVIGRSTVIGKPVSMLLQNRDATVTMCHSRTTDIAGICRNADLLVVAAGKAGIVDRRFVHPHCGSSFRPSRSDHRRCRRQCRSGRRDLRRRPLRRRGTDRPGYLTGSRRSRLRHHGGAVQARD